jgi:hypothetical protein
MPIGRKSLLLFVSTVFATGVGSPLTLAKQAASQRQQRADRHEERHAHCPVHQHPGDGAVSKQLDASAHASPHKRQQAHIQEKAVRSREDNQLQRKNQRDLPMKQIVTHQTSAT